MKIEAPSAAAVWEGSFRLAGEFVVPAGSLLTILPGTRVEAEPGSSLRVEGRLEARGAPGAEIAFAPRGAWRGLALHGSAYAALSHARIKGADNAVRCDDESRAELSDCEILETRYVGVLGCGRGALDVAGCWISLNETGVTLHGAARALVRASRLCVNELCGVNAMAQSRLSIEGCEFVGNHTAISLSGAARADVLGGRIRRNQVGIFASGKAFLNIVDNRFEENGHDVDLLEEAWIAARAPSEGALR